MITKDAIQLMNDLATKVGFSSRSEHDGPSPVSVGDHKGASIAVCVFHDQERAEKYKECCEHHLVSLAEKLEVAIVPARHDTLDDQFLVTITGYDLCTRAESIVGFK